MYIPNYYTQIYPLFGLQLVVETFGHSTNEPTNQDLLKVPKVVKLMNNLF